MEEVEWGEYKIKELFDSVTGDFDIQKRHINNSGEFVVTAGLTDNGVLGKSDVEARVIDANTITIDMFGNSFYRQFKYKLVTHARVFALIPKFKMSEKQGLFIVNSFKTLPTMFGYENMCSWTKIKDRLIKLPIKDNQIDFDFMDTFIAELEAERIAELSAYLKVSGLDNYELSDEELKALQDYEAVEWKEIPLGEIFEVNTYKKRFDANKVTLTDNIGHPYVVRKSIDNGIKGYIQEDEMYLNDGNTISFGQDTATAFYQEHPYFTGDKIKILKAKFEGFNKKNAQLFVTAITRSFTKFSWGSSSYSIDIINKQFLSIPTINGNIDTKYLELLSQAISKLAIKDVVQYTNERIETTKEVVTSHNTNY